MYSPIMAQTSTNRCPPLSKQGGNPQDVSTCGQPIQESTLEPTQTSPREIPSSAARAAWFWLVGTLSLRCLPNSEASEAGLAWWSQGTGWCGSTAFPGLFFGSAIIIYHGLFMKFPDTCPCCFGRPTGQNMAHCLPPWLMTHQFSRLVELLIHMYPLLSLFGL